MPDVQGLFRMSAQKLRQEPGALERQHARQRRRSRNRRIGAFALVAALGIAATVFAVQVWGGHGRSRPATEPTSIPELECVAPNPGEGCGNDRLFDLETGEMTPLPNSIIATGRNGYAISPNGSEVAYYGPAEDVSRQVRSSSRASTGRMSGRLRTAEWPGGSS